MSRGWIRSCVVVVILGVLAVGGLGVLWFLLGAPGGAPPTVQILQPASGASLESGQALILVADGASSLGVERFDVLLDGAPVHSAAGGGRPAARLVYPWFATKIGVRTLSVIAYDRLGRPSAPAAVQVAVSGAGARQPAADSQPLDVRELAQPRGEPAAAPGEAPAGGAAAPGEAPPADPNAVPRPGVDQNAAPAAPLEDNEPPTLEMTLDPQRLADGSVNVRIQARARDNVGVDFMQLIVQPDAGVPQRFIHECRGIMDCPTQGGIALGAGRWAFVMHAFDLAGQVSRPGLDIVEVLCQPAADPNAGPECAVAAEDPPPAGEAPGGGAAAGPAFNVPPFNPDLSLPAFEPPEALGAVQCLAFEPPQESFNRLGCDFVLPADPAAGRVTSCPNAVLIRLDLRGVDLRGADLHGAFMEETNLRCGADLRGADLTRTNLHLAVADDSTLFDPKWRLVWTVVNAVAPPPQSLQGADLSGANLYSADLYGADLRNANLRGALLLRTNLFRADLTGADLTDAQLVNVICPDGQVRDVNCDGHMAPLRAGVDPLQIGDCSIVQPVTPNGPVTECEGAALGGKDLRDVDLTRARLAGASLNNSDLRGTILTGADLSGVDMKFARTNDATRMDPKWLLVWGLQTRGGRGMDLSALDLSDAFLFWADLRDTQLVGTDFTNANLLHAQLSGANVQGARWGNTTCPDGTNSNDAGGTCEGHLDR